MPLTVALAGDTMFGRGVAARLAEVGPRSLVAQEVRDVAAEADLFVLNLECCISERGEPWEAPGKPFFFRAPPVAVETLTWLGVHAVTLANNHALDFGPDALHDTLGYLAGAGIAAVGAGADEAQAREPAVLQARGVRLGVLGATDHPADFAAGPQRSGVAYADLHAGVPAWLVDGVRRLRAAADLVLVTPHWGPNMTPGPVGPTWGGCCSSSPFHETCHNGSWSRHLAVATLTHALSLPVAVPVAAGAVLGLAGQLRPFERV